MPFDATKINPDKRLEPTIGSRSINLMCAILKGIDYRTLYTEPLHTKVDSTLEKMIKNTNGLHEDLQINALGGPNPNPKTVLADLDNDSGALLEIRDLLADEDYPRVTLGELFYADVTYSQTPGGAILYQIVNILERVHAVSNGGPDLMYHFCAPFLAVQKHRIPPIDKDDFDEFISMLGHKTLKQLYDKTAYTDCEKAAAKNAIRLGILKERYRPNRPPEGAGISSGNKMKCGPATAPDAGNKCGASTNPDDWCSDYQINGTWYCTLGSD